MRKYNSLLTDLDFDTTYSNKDLIEIHTDELFLYLRRQRKELMEKDFTHLKEMDFCPKSFFDELIFSEFDIVEQYFNDNSLNAIYHNGIFEDLFLKARDFQHELKADLIEQFRNEE